MISLRWELFRFDFFKYVMSTPLHLTCQSPALPDSPAWLQGVALFILDPDCCFLTYAGFCFSQPQQQVILLRSLAKCGHLSNMRKHHWRDRLPVYYMAFFFHLHDLLSLTWACAHVVKYQGHVEAFSGSRMAEPSAEVKSECQSWVGPHSPSNKLNIENIKTTSLFRRLMAI